MTTAFTAFVFTDNIENGGEVVKLRIFCVQSFKVAEKTVREGIRQKDGSMRQTGPIKRVKYDLYLVDCAVTGSSNGTSKDPKSSLQRFFEYCIFSCSEEVCGGGRKVYEGYKPVCQGGGAGPHVEVSFLEFICTSCDREGWVWEP